LGDKPGEAKSSGNLGNTLKVMGNFDEAMICCKRHLEIARELGDKVILFILYCEYLYIKY
jgi:G-protein signaling modulator 2